MTATSAEHLAYQAQRLEKQFNHTVQQFYRERLQVRAAYRYAPIPALGWVQATPTHPEGASLTLPASAIFTRLNTQHGNGLPWRPLTTQALLPYQLNTIHYQSLQTGGCCTLTLTPIITEGTTAICLHQFNLAIHPDYCDAAQLFYHLKQVSTQATLHRGKQSYPLHFTEPPLFCLQDYMPVMFAAYLNPLGLFLKNPRFDLRLSLQLNQPLSCPAAQPLVLRFNMANADTNLQQTLNAQHFLFNAIPVIQLSRQRSDWCDLKTEAQTELRLDRYRDDDTLFIHSVQAVYMGEPNTPAMPIPPYWPALNLDVNHAHRFIVTKPSLYTIYGPSHAHHQRPMQLKRYPSHRPIPNLCYADLNIMSSAISPLHDHSPLAIAAAHADGYRFHGVYSDTPTYPVCVDEEDEMADTLITTLQQHDLCQQQTAVIHALQVKRSELRLQGYQQDNQLSLLPYQHQTLTLPRDHLTPAMQWIWERQLQRFVDHHHAINQRQVIHLESR